MQGLVRYPAPDPLSCLQHLSSSQGRISCFTLLERLQRFHYRSGLYFFWSRPARD
jgi:hypothetical protein